MEDITITTTDSIEGKEIEVYLGIVAGEAIMGANIIKDAFAGIRDVTGGRSGPYKKVISKGRENELTITLELLAKEVLP